MLRRSSSSFFSSRTPSVAATGAVLRRAAVSSTSLVCRTENFRAISATARLVQQKRALFSSTAILREEDPSAAAAAAAEKKFSLPSWTDPNSKDLYNRLGLKRDASIEDIKKHYRHLSRMYHPDINKEKSAEQKFLNVKEAYETLSDSQKRNVYNSTGASWSQQEQYQRAGGGANPFTYSSSFVWSNRAVNPTMTRGLILVIFFSIGAVLSALVELKSRRSNKEKMSDQQAELSQQRSSLWRPFFGMLIFISMLPRLPAVLLCWYFYAFLPTVKAEDRATKDPTIIIKDEMGTGGKIFRVKVWSPYLEMLSRAAASAGGKGLDHILVAYVQPDESKLTIAQQNELRDALSALTPKQMENLMGVMEYPATAMNMFEMSVPRPILFIKSMGGMVPVPAQVKIKVKTVVKDAQTGRIATERGETVFEKTLDI